MSKEMGMITGTCEFCGQQKMVQAESEAVEMAVDALSADVETDGDMGEVSDGYHTFNQLYHQRAVLFATIVKQNKEKAWKSWKHGDGKFCFDSNKEWFIVGVDTPEGSYTYHYEKKYWDMFDCVELEHGKFWDGHTEKDVTRLLSLPSADAVPQMEHDREWIIGCIKHDGFIKTDRFDKANQIILDALSADTVSREDIIGYIDRVSNSGIGKKKALEYIRKYVERTESADAVHAKSGSNEQTDKQSMTKEKAIRRLREYAQYSYGIWHDGKEDTRAFDMAIEALSAEPKTGEWITYYPFMLSIEGQRFNGAKNPTKPIPDKRFGRIKCSLCGCPHPIPNDKYCPGCGARMLNGERYE